MIKELLSESGSISTMRVMSLICVLIACFIGITGLYLNKDLVSLAALCSAFLVPAFGAKAFQKNMELK